MAHKQNKQGSIRPRLVKPTVLQLLHQLCPRSTATSPLLMDLWWHMTLDTCLTASSRRVCEAGLPLPQYAQGDHLCRLLQGPIWHFLVQMRQMHHHACLHCVPIHPTVLHAFFFLLFWTHLSSECAWGVGSRKPAAWTAVGEALPTRLGVSCWPGAIDS